MLLDGKISFILLVASALLMSSCGGSSTGGGTTPPPPPSTANEWAWMSGSSTAGAAGVYGALGVASASNVPGARNNAVSWTDSSGNLWLFGGWGGSLGTTGLLNDLWKFSPTTKEWTWVSGSNTPGAIGFYGTQGVASASNVPGAREGAASWIDTSGNLWLFGGGANDLWKFSPTTKEWIWVSGSDTPGAIGFYGTQGVASASNVPGARFLSVSWIDSSGNLWLFGGEGYGPTGVNGDLSDLWEFNPTAKTWTWVSGSSTANSKGVYGTLGVASASNVPGARFESVSWIDSHGNFWLFGGDGYDSTGADGFLNDLWEFDPTTKEWTWISGSSTVNASGIYGTQGVPAITNVPGNRFGAINWIDSSGNFWLFGGAGEYSNGYLAGLNDLWEFNPTTKVWTWMSGNSMVNASGIYGTQGVPAITNVPGNRSFAISWIDTNGNLWLFGGLGVDSTDTIGVLNDLWRYQP
jgi:N-acetylneuraminic acid mutarotase